MRECPAPEDLAQLASPAGESVQRAAMADHAASCESCHAVLLVLLAEGTQATHATGDTPPLRASRGDRDAVPTAIARYVIRRKLGSGGMGVVYLAHDPELGRELAIKVLRRGSSADRLRREAQALARLSHPNVVTVHDVGEHDGQTFVAMALVDGVNLREWLATRRDPPAVIAVLAQAARGIIAAHAAGLVHRDLKPDNIFVAADGAVQVGDFGLARDLEDGEQPPADGSARLDDLTATGSVLGTPAYMAPEQAKGRADERSDQFSFCVTAYEALAGTRPFRGATLDELVAAVARGAIPALPRDRAVPARVERALRRGLAASPGERFSSMAELLAELEPRRAGWPFVVAGAGALGAAVALTAVVARSEPAADPEVECASTATMIDRVWSARRHESTADVLRAQGLTAGAAAELTNRIDAYATTWTEVRRATCVADVSQQLPPPLAAARVACLDRVADLLDETASGLVTKDGVDVFAAWKRVTALPSPLICRGDDAALLLPSARELYAALEVAADAVDDARLGDAETALSRARPLAEQLGAPSARVRAAALSARALCLQGKDADATKFLDVAIAGSQRMVDLEHQAAVDELADARIECLFRRGEYDAVVPLLEGRLSSLQKRHGKDGLEAASLRWRLAAVYVSLGRRAEAAQQTATAQQIQRSYVAHAKEAAVAENQLALSAIERQDLEAALVHSQRSVELHMSLGDDVDLQIALVDLGMLYGVAADEKAAITTYTIALDRFPDVPALEQNAGYRADALDSRGWLRLHFGDHAGAVTDFQEAIAIAKRIGKPELFTSSQIGLGSAWVALGEHERAVRILREGLAGHRGSRVGRGQFALAQALWETGERPQAIAIARAAETEVAKGLEMVKQSPIAKRLVPVNEVLLAKVEQWRDTHR